jgi:hypothetical protein
LGSKKMAQFADASDNQNKVVSVLTVVEGTSAICRLRQGKFIRPSEASAALVLLSADFETMVQQTANPRVIQAAKAMTDRHHLRALDAIQLGSAIVARDLLAAPDMRFIASDIDLLAAARAEGFDTWNPCD